MTLHPLPNLVPFLKATRTRTSSRPVRVAVLREEQDLATPPEGEEEAHLQLWNNGSSSDWPDNSGHGDATVAGNAGATLCARFRMSFLRGFPTVLSYAVEGNDNSILMGGCTRFPRTPQFKNYVTTLFFSI